MTDATIARPAPSPAVPPATDASTSRRAGALLALVLAAGAILRFAALDQESYWIDEITMLSVSGGTLGEAFATVLTGRPPLFVLLLGIWIDLFGTSEAATRALTAVIGTASLGILYRAGRLLVGRTAALVAVAVMAIAPIQLYQSQNVRYYALVVLLAIVAAGTMVRFLETGGRRWLAAYVVSAALLVHAHTYGVFVIAAHDLYLILALRRHRDRLGAWAVGQLAVGALVAPFLWLTIAHSTSGGNMPTNWLPPVEPLHVVVTLREFVTLALPGPLGLAAAAICLALGAMRAARGRAAAVVERREPASARGVHTGLFLACWLAVPILAPFVLSLVAAPMYLTRYTLGAAPALYLLIGLAVVRASRRVAPAFGAAAVCALVLPATIAYYPQQLKEDWRAASAYLEREVRPGDRILLVPNEHGDTERALRWYFDVPVAACGLDEAAGVDPQAAAREVRRCAAGARRVWLLVRGPEPITAPFVRFVRQDWAHEMRPVASRNFTGIELHLVQREETRR